MNSILLIAIFMSQHAIRGWSPYSESMVMQRFDTVKQCRLAAKNLDEAEKAINQENLNMHRYPPQYKCVDLNSGKDELAFK